MMFKSTLLALGFVMFSCAANATLLDFEYTYSDGSVLSGTLDGTIQSDGDTVFVNGFGDVSMNGVLMPTITAGEFISISDFPAGGSQPLLSFSGGLMDLFVCASGFITGNCDFATGGGFYFDSGVYGSGAGTLGAGMVFEGFSAANWSLSAPTSSIPEPASLLVFGLGLAGLSLSGRKQKAK